ncbi:MAG: flagellin lysine-N-methylase, partial [Lachnospiraceae bacterium]|nr:flagellin lysine-N-methylase [Lachnospiraceae bacterium]
MEIKRISILNEFKCIAKDCPANCCRNSWKVPIDSDMYTRYRNEKGIWGLLLRCSTVKRQGVTTFRNTFRGCLFWGTDHLCSIQKKHGTSYMPAVCIQFPRQLYNLKFFCEETLYLACPEAARLFLSSAAEGRPFAFTVTEGNVSYKVNTTNDDKEFLDYLLKARDELIQMLENGIPFDSMAILHYGQDAQNACLDKTPLPSPQDYDSPQHYRMTCERIND